MTTRKLVVIFLTSFVPTIALANGESELSGFYGDDDFISIATGVSQPISKAPAVASVITSKDIANMGATDLDSVLETIPGLHVSTRAQGYAPNYVFRGIYTGSNPQVLMLINGIPLYSLYLGDRNQVWGGIPVESISRIEVIRGPGSAVYGADAFAGVINVVTKEASESTGLNVGARYGSFNTKDWWLSYGKTSDKLELSAHIEIHDTDGHREKIYHDAQSFLDILSSTNTSLAPGSVNLNRNNLDARFKIRLDKFLFNAGIQTRDDYGVGAGLAQALDSEGQVSSNRYNADLTYENTNLTENLGIKATISYLQTSQEVDSDLILYPPGSRGPFFVPGLFPPTPAFPPFPYGVIGNPEVYERHYRSNVAGTYRGLDNHEILVGTGYYYGDVYKTEEEKNFGINPSTGLPILPGSGLVDVSDTPLVFLPEDNRENGYIFVQDVWHFAHDWELTAGVRYDHYSDFGDTVNPRLALVWSTAHNLTTKLLYGEAFRAPSFAETRVQSNPTVLGNANLKPETLKSYELAFNYRPTFNINIDLNVFYYEWEDIIQFVPDPGGLTRTAQNVGEQNAEGLEIELSWNINDYLSLLTNYAWQNAEDQTTDTDAANAPEQQFYIRGMATLPHDFDFSVQLNRVMDRNRAFDDARSDIDDYTVVDVTMRKRFLGDQLELALLAKNIFDENAREPTLSATPVPLIPDDLPLAGRTLLAEMRYKFF